MTQSDLQLFNSIGTAACRSVDFQHCVFLTPFDSVRNELRELSEMLENISQCTARQGSEPFIDSNNETMQL